MRTTIKPLHLACLIGLWKPLYVLVVYLMEKEDDIRLGKLIDVPYRKNYIGGILQVYFKYTSFILQILEV